MLSDGGKRRMKAEDRNARLWRFRCTYKILKWSKHNPDAMACKPQNITMLEPRPHTLLLKFRHPLRRPTKRKNRTMMKATQGSVAACSFAAVIFAKRHSNIARVRHIRTLTSQKKKKKEPCFIVSVDHTSWTSVLWRPSCEAHLTTKQH